MMKNQNKKKILPINERHILVFAFRYALGRRSAAPSLVVEMLKTKWEGLDAFDKRQIQEEINQAITGGYAGDFCDVECWTEILKLEVEE